MCVERGLRRDGNNNKSLREREKKNHTFQQVRTVYTRFRGPVWIISNRWLFSHSPPRHPSTVFRAKNVNDRDDDKRVFCLYFTVAAATVQRTCRANGINYNIIARSDTLLFATTTYRIFPRTIALRTFGYFRIPTRSWFTIRLLFDYHNVYDPITRYLFSTDSGFYTMP